MIPSVKQIDPDLVKMFADAENKSLKQSAPPNVIVDPKNHVESTRSVWADNASNLNAFEYGYHCGNIGADNIKPDTKMFLSDLFKGLRQCISNETDKIGGEKNHDSFLAIQHIINILSEKYVASEAANEEAKKINIEHIVAALHGYLTSYIVSNFKPNLKK